MNDDDALSLDAMFLSRFKRATDISPNGDIVQIEKVYKETVSEDTGEKKWALKFVGDPVPMTLNKTNGSTLGRLFGARDRRQWIGKYITLRARDVMGPSGMTLGIRIEPAEKAAPSVAKPEFSDTVDDIRM
jgi:hypothetical protein